MFCTKCGKPVDAGAAFCALCGSAVQIPPSTPAYTPSYPLSQPAHSQTSVAAILSLVFGILGPCCVGITGILGFILGIVALRQIRRGEGKLTGKGLAIAGVVISGLTMLILPVVMVGIWKDEKANRVTCANHLSALHKSVAMYTMDYDQTYPPDAKWTDAVSPYVGDTAIYKCPNNQALLSECSYSLNAGLSASPISSISVPGETVELFEADDGWNHTGGADMVRSCNRMALMGESHICFSDGHVKILPIRRIRNSPAVIWNVTPLKTP